jgi:phosphoglycerate dehydrogenase-like enzyme
LPEDNELWDLDQVVITPHTTGYISHFEDAQFKILWPNLQSFLQNQQLSVNEVKLDRGY